MKALTVTDTRTGQLRLVDLGYLGADALVPLVFGVVVATIVAHGFSAGWVARRPRPRGGGAGDHWQLMRPQRRVASTRPAREGAPSASSRVAHHAALSRVCSAVGMKYENERYPVADARPAGRGGRSCGVQGSSGGFCHSGPLSGMPTITRVDRRRCRRLRQ